MAVRVTARTRRKFETHKTGGRLLGGEYKL